MVEKRLASNDVDGRTAATTPFNDAALDNLVLNPSLGLSDSKLYEDDDHLLDNLVCDDGGQAVNMYQTERIDSLKLLADS